VSRHGRSSSLGSEIGLCGSGGLSDGSEAGRTGVPSRTGVRPVIRRSKPRRFPCRARRSRTRTRSHSLHREPRPSVFRDSKTKSWRALISPQSLQVLTTAHHFGTPFGTQNASGHATSRTRDKPPETTVWLNHAIESPERGGKSPPAGSGRPLETSRYPPVTKSVIGVGLCGFVGGTWRLPGCGTWSTT
jgi:hypothetical protein